MKCVIFSLLILLSACSKSDNSSKIESPIQESFLSAVVGQEEEILLDLGSVPYGKTKDGLVTIKQNQSALLVPSGLVSGKLVLDESSSPELSILSQSGCTSIKRSTGTCNIKIRANSQGLQEGSVIQGSILVHIDPLTEAETRINITAVVGDAPVVENPVALVSSTSASLNFGEMSITDKPKDLIVTYKATSLLKSEDSLQVNIPSPFALQSPSADGCSNKNISRNSSCTVKIRLDPKSVSTNGLISGNITFAGLSISVSATITGNPEEGQPVDSPLAWIYNGSEISLLDLGTLLSSNVPVKFNLYLKNKSSSNETVNVTISGSGFNIINRCQNKELLPNAQCSLEVRPESSVGTKSVSISVDGQPSLSLPLSLVVTTTVEPVVTYATVDTTASCSSLNLQICGGTQNISKTYICEQYVDGIKNESYSGNDCQPLADMSPLICQSSPGNLLVGILGGNLSYNCGAGVSSNDITPTVLCDQGYSPDQLNLACIEDVVIPNRPLGKSYGFNANVLAIEIQEDGKIVVGGAFTTYNGTSSQYIARLNSDGSLDTSFNVGSGFNGDVHSIAIQEDGKIVVGGAFSGYNGLGASRIVRLNSDGSRDTSFIIGSVFNEDVRTIAIQEDGKMVVGGNFTTYNGTTSNSIVRINSDGSLDTSFTVGTGFNATVNSIAIQEDGKILVGGNFSTYKGTTSGRIARLNSDGSLDNTFTVGSGFNNAVYSIAIQEDGKIVAGGQFASYNGTSTARIARINSDGSRDTSFTQTGSGLNSSVYSIAIQEDGKIVAGGQFASYNGTSTARIARINSDGSLDISFNVGSGFNNVVSSIAIQEDGKIVAGGQFASYNGTSSNYTVRINSDGSLDTSVNVGSGFNNIVSSIAIQEDGKIVAGGQFVSYNGTTINRIARFNSDGSLDTSFTQVGTGFNNFVNSIAIQEDGKIVAGGGFTSYNGTTINRIARINSDGSLDISFNVGSGFSGMVYSIVIQEDGKIVVGGDFTTYKGTSSSYIVRLNSDGSLDTSFNVGSGFNGNVRTIAIQEDGKILVGGYFTNYNGTTISRIARINSDGSPDASFNVGSGFNGDVYSIAIQEDGKIVAGGAFSTYNYTPAKYIARLNSDGSLDTSFTVGSGFSSTVNTISIQEDGKIVVGGQFVSYNGKSYDRIIRLNPDGTTEE